MGVGMQVADAQRQIRLGYLGGFMGQLVSGVLWLASAAFATWGSNAMGIWVLALGGFFIFPLTRLGLAIIGRKVAVPADNPLNALAMQVAFTLPMTLPLVGAAALYRVEWFYPAFMIVLGAHYLPFVFLYGMKMFAALSAILVSAGVALALYVQLPLSAGGWFTGAMLLVFAVLGKGITSREGTFTSAG